jgi:hypothetical protein
MTIKEIENNKVYSMNIDQIQLWTSQVPKFKIDKYIFDSQNSLVGIRRSEILLSKYVLFVSTLGIIFWVCESLIRLQMKSEKKGIGTFNE